MEPLEVVFAPFMVFMIIVAPLWIIMHYRSVNRSSRSLNEDDRGALDSMLATQDKLIDRIHTLESILDSDHPNWRQQERAHGGQHG